MSKQNQTQARSDYRRIPIIPQTRVRDTYEQYTDCLYFKQHFFRQHTHERSVTNRK